MPSVDLSDADYRLLKAIQRTAEADAVPLSLEVILSQALRGFAKRLRVLVTFCLNCGASKTESTVDLPYCARCEGILSR